MTTIGGLATNRAGRPTGQQSHSGGRPLASLLQRVNTLLERADIRAATMTRVVFDFVVMASTLPAVAVARRALTGGTTDPGESLGLAVVGGLILGSVSVNVFTVRGFYRQNRLFRPRRKIRAVAQGVALSHLVFGGIVLVSGSVLTFDPAVLPISAMVGIVALAAARLCSSEVPVVRSLVEQLDGQPAGLGPNRSVLVVGGGGYIGSGLLTRLLARGYEVRLLDLLMFGEDPIRDVIDHPNLELIRGDFRQVDTVVRATRGVDTVIHLGAIVGDPACEVDHRLTVDTNLLAAQMVAEVSKAAGVRRFVFASTCSVYGAADEILDEGSHLNPVSLYAKTKIACEEVLTEIQDEQMSVVILRFGTIYGFSGRTRFDLVVNLLTAKAIIDGEITVFGGDQWRPFLHVDDASAAVLAAVEAPPDRIQPQVFNVGSDEQNYTIGQVAELIGEMVPSAEILNLGTDGDRRDYRVDFSRIRKYLNFTPAWTVEMGIQQVIDAISSGKVTDYTDAIYSNVKTLNDGLESNGETEPATIDLRAEGEADAHLRYLVRKGSGGPWTASLIDSGQPEPAVVGQEPPAKQVAS